MNEYIISLLSFSIGCLFTLILVLHIIFERVKEEAKENE